VGGSHKLAYHRLAGRASARPGGVEVGKKIASIALKTLQAAGDKG
jgi:hypothetical protein